MLDQEQSVPNQPGLWFLNRGLFSDHFLRARLPHWREWKSDNELGQFGRQLRRLYEDKKPILAFLNEPQTEKEFVQPVLDLLGYANAYIVQAPTQIGERTNWPDYALFPDQATKNKAYESLKDNHYALCMGVADAKHWERELDVPKASSRDTFTNQNPSFQIHSYLVATKQTWGILTNGRLWRLYCSKSHVPLANYYQVDAAQLLDGPEEALKYFYLFFRKAALVRIDGKSFLDRVLEESNQYAVELEADIKDRAYEVVEGLCRGFAAGFPPAELTEQTLRAIYDNSLTLLYRLLFVFYAEARELLSLTTNQAYRDRYSIHRLTQEIDETLARGYELSTRSTIYYQRIDSLFKLINEGDRNLGVPEYNGGLFSPEDHPFLERHAIADAFLVKAIHQLARIPDKELGREVAVDYNTLSERHLGSIYEGLLEFEPRIANSDLVVIREKSSTKYAPADRHPEEKIAYRRGELHLANDKGERKASGSYYTPEYVVTYIIKNTLSPLTIEAREEVRSLSPEVVKNVAKWEKLKEQKQDLEPTDKYDRAIAKERERLLEPYLSLKVVDPAMGSGHFLARATDFLAEAIISDPCITPPKGIAEDSELTYYRRRVVESCVYGVDLNPLAVELAKLTLWLATMAESKPLSFLNHHLRVGNSLIGARVDDLDEIGKVKRKMKAASPDRAPVQLGLFKQAFNEKLYHLLQNRALVAQLPTQTLEDVRNKEKWERDFAHSMQRFRILADLSISTCLGNSVAWDEYNTLTENIQSPKSDWERLLKKESVQKAIAMGREKHFFHWELEFPEVFFDKTGERLQNPGFAAVVGNPPYYLLQGTELQNIVKWTDPDIFTGSNDVSHFFLKRACQQTRAGGRFGFIVTRYWMEAHFGSSLRGFLTEHASPALLVDFGNLQVWPEANVLTVIAVFSRGEQGRSMHVYVGHDGDDKSAQAFLERCASNDPYCHYEVEPGTFGESAWHPRALRSGNLWDKVKKLSTPLGELCETTQGVKTGNNAVFTVSTEAVVGRGLESDWLLPLAQAQSIQRYEVLDEKEYVIYTDGSRDIQEAPNIASYLLPHEHLLRQRAECREGLYPWWRLQRPRDPELIRSSTRILVPLYATHNRFFPTAAQLVGMTDVYIMVPRNNQYSYMFLAAVLNSTLLDSYHRTFCKIKRARYLEYSGAALASLPVRCIQFSTPQARRRLLVEKGNDLYHQCLPSRDWTRVLLFVDDLLPRKSDGSPDTDSEQSDVIHDFLAFLAERMTELHREKQSKIGGFLVWLEKEILKGSVEEQKNKTRIRDFHNSTFEDLLDVLKKNKVVRDPCPSDVRDTIAGEFSSAAGALTRLKARIEATDELIDQIVYRLYGLSHAEIAIVEQR